MNLRVGEEFRRKQAREWPEGGSFSLKLGIPFYMAEMCGGFIFKERWSDA